MIIISILAACIALLVIYFLLQGNLNTYKEKKRSFLLTSIEQWERDIVNIYSEIDNYKKILKTLELKEEVTIKNMSLMETNSRSCISNKKLQMNQYYEEAIQREKKIIETRIIEKVFRDLLEGVSHNNAEDMNKVLEQIKPLILERK